VLTGFGLFLTTLGVLLFLDRGLLAIGNILFLVGVSLIIGLQKTFVFFFQQRKLKGTIPFLGGIFLVIIGWPFVGMVMEIFGFINLFGNFFPYVLQFLQRMPITGTILNLPGVRQIVDKLVTKRLPV